MPFLSMHQVLKSKLFALPGQIQRLCQELTGRNEKYSDFLLHWLTLSCVNNILLSSLIFCHFILGADLIWIDAWFISPLRTLAQGKVNQLVKESGGLMTTEYVAEAFFRFFELIHTVMLQSYYWKQTAPTTIIKKYFHLFKVAFPIIISVIIIVLSALWQSAHVAQWWDASTRCLPTKQFSTPQKYFRWSWVLKIIQYLDKYKNQEKREKSRD